MVVDVLVVVRGGLVVVVGAVVVVDALVVVSGVVVVVTGADVVVVVSAGCATAAGIVVTSPLSGTTATPTARPKIRSAVARRAWSTLIGQA